MKEKLTPEEKLQQKLRETNFPSDDFDSITGTVSQQRTLRRIFGTMGTPIPIPSRGFSALNEKTIKRIERNFYKNNSPEHREAVFRQLMGWLSKQ